MKANLIGLIIDGNFVQCEQEVTLNYEQEMLPTSSKAKGAWLDYIGGYKGWSIDVGSRFSVGTDSGYTNKALEKYINTPDAVYELYLTNIFGANPEFYIKGLARLKNGSINAPNTGSASHSQSFVGCGALESWAEEYWRIINAMPVPEDKPNIVDTTKW